MTVVPVSLPALLLTERLTVGVVTEHAFKAVRVLRGAGAPIVKSVLLLSVSVQPLLLRRSAVVLLSAGVGLVSEKLAAPKPIKSTTPVVGLLPVSAI